MLNDYFDTFFSEKNLLLTTWELQDNQGTNHIVSSDVIIEAIKAAPDHEQEQIRDVLVKIDFVNGDVLDFLQHLAQGMINLWADGGHETC